jgi:hypothetical protein
LNYFEYRLQRKSEFLKILRGIDRVRTRSKVKYESELKELQETGCLKYEQRLNEYSYYESIEELNKARWLEELESNNTLLKFYVKDEYLASRYSTSELKYSIEGCAIKSNYKYNEEFVKYFEEEISCARCNLLRKGVVPVSFLVEKDLFLKNKNQKDCPADIIFSKSFFFVSSVGTEFCFMEKGITDSAIEKSLFDHYEITTNNALTRSPLLIFEVESSDDRERDRIIDKFLWFRMITDYFILYHEMDSLIFARQSHPHMEHYFSLNNGVLYRYPKDFDSSFKLEFTCQKFEMVLQDEMFSYVLDVYDRNGCYVRNKIYNALHFFSKAHRETDNVDKFLGYIISIEAMCSVANTNIGNNLCNFIKGESYKGDGSEYLVKAMKDAYSLRSKIVHHGASYISSSSTEVAKKLALVVIRKALRLYKELAKNDEPVTLIEWREKVAKIGID